MDKRERLHNRIKEVITEISKEIVNQMDNSKYLDCIDTSSRHITFHSDKLEGVRSYSRFGFGGDPVTDDWGRYSGDIKFSTHTNQLKSTNWYERKTDITKRIKKIVAEVISSFDYHVEKVLEEERRSNKENNVREFINSFTTHNYFGEVKVDNLYGSRMTIKTDIHYAEENAEEIEALVRELNEKVTALNNK